MSAFATPLAMARKWSWVAAGLAMVALAAWANRFPDGMVFAGGDVAQYFDRAYVERNFHHIWSHLIGQGFFSPSFLYYPFYAALFTVSDLFGMTPSGESVLYMLFLWGGSYAGWLLAHALSRDSRVGIWSVEANLAALMYALNPYTFYAFYFIWGYSPFLFLYAIFPVVATATLEYFAESDRDRSRRLLAILFVAHLLATIAYTNLPFFIGLNLMVGALVVLEAFFGRTVGGRALVLKAVAYLAVELVATAWAIFPQLPGLLLDGNPIEAETQFSSWILWQRLPVWEILTLNPAGGRYLQNAGPLAALAPIIVTLSLLAWLLRDPARRGTARALALLCAVAIVVLVESKGLGIVPGAAAIWAFNNPLLGALRSNGKMAIFLPFLLLSLMMFGLAGRGQRTRIAFLGACFVVFLLSAYPMVSGSLQTIHSVGMTKGEECATARFCYLNRIPPEYAGAAEAIRKDGLPGKILSLPYSVMYSANWVYYPPWKHLGVDPTGQLFPLPMVQMNTHDSLFRHSYGREWEQAGPDNPQPLLQLAGEIGAPYLLFHRDVHGQYVHPAAQYLRHYAEGGYLEPLFEDGALTVYRIPQRYRRSLVSANGESGTLASTEASPTLHVVTFAIRPGRNELVLRETFSTQWKAHVAGARLSTRPAGDETRWWAPFFLPTLPEDSHGRYARYANRWEFDGDWFCRQYECASSPEGGRSTTLIVEYAPQRYVYALQLLAALGAACAAIIFILGRHRMAHPAAKRIGAAE